MRLLQAAVAAGFVFSSPAIVAADTIKNFNVTGEFVYSFGGDLYATLSGVLKIDTTIGSILAANLFVTDVVNDTFGPYTIVYDQGYTALDGDYGADIYDKIKGGTTVSLLFDTPTLVGYNGGLLDSYEHPSPTNVVTGFGGAAAFGLQSGSVSAVPLPFCAPMFGAALLGLGAIGYGLKRMGKPATAV